MTKFCNQCGRPLADGEVCNCQQNQYADQNINMEKPGQKQAEQEHEKETITISTEDWIPIKKLLGFGESDLNDVEGCFERNKKIVPELVCPCEQEITIKQYEICHARSRIRGLWQEGRVQVTNKRILFRLSGRSWIGKAMDHIEFNIDEVAGLDISNGVRFAIWDALLGILLTVFISMLGMTIGKASSVFGVLLSIATIALFFVLKKKYFCKILILALGVGTAVGVKANAMVAAYYGEGKFLGGFSIVLLVIATALLIASIVLFALKPSLSIQIKTKCASEAPIYIWSHQTMASVMEVLPGRDAELAMEELGAMISDVQKFGDYGIKKWKED